MNLSEKTILLSFFVLGLAACPSDDDPTGDETDTGTTGGETETATTQTSNTMPTTMTATETTETTETSTTTETGTTTTITESGTDTEATTATDTDATTGGMLCDENVIELPGDMLFPEGIDAHSNGTLYVGSLTSGEILAVTPCEDPTGEHIVQVFNDGADTMSAIGLFVDETNDILWACSSDFTGVNPAEILGFSLDDGSLQATHAFDAGVCNDLAMDGEGNLYATETFGSRIMRVQAGDLLSNTDAEEWDADNLYAVAQGELGLNGIASDGDSVLYTVNTATGEMYRTAILQNGNADDPTVVDLDGTTLLGPDGVEPEADNVFLVVEQAAPALTRITLDPGGNTVEQIDTDFDVPTTAVVVGSNVWVVESQLDHLIDPDNAGPPEPPFVLVRRPL